MEIDYDGMQERLAFLDFGDVHDTDLLDIGAGHGKLTVVAASLRNCTVTCIDPHPEKLERARHVVEGQHVAGKVTFVQGDARRLPYPDCRFSCVACFSLFHHVDPQDREAVLGEAIRVARHKLLVSELTMDGAKIFDETLHPDEHHLDSIIKPGWFLARLVPHGKTTCATRRWAYHIMLVKNE